MIKRSADLLEKIAAGSFLIGMFQGRGLALATGLILFSLCLVLTRRADRREEGSK
ncbi:hypothetical protein FACS189460_5420 [Deltaproteobacteria bacterium]|nr:hypothetical protein FACS189460_5420 [Deltaproteobacteria bacterium]